MKKMKKLLVMSLAIISIIFLLPITKANARSVEPSVVNEAYNQLGKPFAFGGVGPNGFDNGGFTQYVYKQVGVSIGRTPYEQIKNGAEVKQAELEPGDLIFTSASNVGIYVGNNQMIFMAMGDVVKVSNINSFYAARRIISTNNETPKANDLKVHFLNVGQGDAILVQQGTHSMLIDGGSNSNEGTIKKYIQDQKVTMLDYVVGTHADDDHIGGLDYIINSFKVGKVFFPKNTATTNGFKDFSKAVTNKKLKITVPKVGETFKLGDAIITVISPSTANNTNENDNSLVLKVTYKKNSFLLTGDIESKSEADILKKKLNIKADVIKIGNHGATTSTTADFLNSVSPKYAVISVAKEKQPQGTLDKLKAKNISLYRTDESGTIVATSDGTKVTFNTKPSSYKGTIPAITKVTANVDNKTPKQYSTVNLTVTGPVKGSVKAVCRYKTTTTTYTGTVGSNGKVIIPIKIAKATKGYSVKVDVIVTSNGKSYTANTAFTPM